MLCCVRLRGQSEDGCSAECKIESGFSCKGGTATSKDECNEGSFFQDASVAIAVALVVLLIVGGSATMYLFAKHKNNKEKKEKLVRGYNTAVMQQLEEANRKPKRPHTSAAAIDRNISSHVQIVYDPSENDGVQEDAVETLRDELSPFFLFFAF